MGRTGRGRSAPAHLGYCDGDEGGPRRRPPRGADPLGLRDHLASLTGLEHGPVRERPEVRRPRKQLPPRLGVGRRTMKTLMIGLGTLVLVALTRPALARRCLSFQPPAFFAGARLWLQAIRTRPTATPRTRTTRTRFPWHRASGSAGAVSTDTSSSGVTRASPATPSPAARPESRRIRQ